MASRRADAWRVFRAWIKKNELEEAWKLVRQRERPPLWTYNALIGLCARRKDLTTAKKLVEEMKRRGIRGDVYTFGSLLDVCAKSRDLKCAEQVWKKAKQRVRPNHVMYNALIQCYAQEKDVRSAFRVHQEKIEAGFPPDLVAYNTLMAACARAGEAENAEAVLKEIQERGLKPNLITWNCLLDTYGRLGKKDDAYRVWTDMKKEKVVPDAVTETTLADLFIDSPEFATSILRESRHMQAQNQPGHEQGPGTEKSKGATAFLDEHMMEDQKLFVLDLHGLSQAGAKLALRNRLKTISEILGKVKKGALVGLDPLSAEITPKNLILITGKGKHSTSGDGVLQDAVTEILDEFCIRYYRPYWNVGRLYIPISTLDSYCDSVEVVEQRGKVLKGALVRYVGVFTIALGIGFVIPTLVEHF